MRAIYSIIGGVIAAFLTDPVFAFTAGDAINAVGPNLAQGGGAGFGSILKDVAGSFKPIAAVAALLAMTIAGFFLALSGNDNQTTTARRVFISSMAGLALINLVDVFADSLISGTFTVNPTTLAPSGNTILDDPLSAGNDIASEALGLVAFLQFPLGVLCVVMIIISGIRAIASFGSEDGVAQLRRTVLFTVAGFILLLWRGTLVVGGGVAGPGIAAGSPSSIMHVMLLVLNRILTFTLILAVAMIVFAGILMIVNLGKDDQYGRAKGLMIRVAIGIILMVASGGIVLLLSQIV